MVKKVIVVHTSYGCGTGCCGHIVEINGQQVGRFKFEHPWGLMKTPDELKQWIIYVVTGVAGAEHVKDIDFENCIVLED